MDVWFRSKRMQLLDEGKNLFLTLHTVPIISIVTTPVSGPFHFHYFHIKLALKGPDLNFY